MKFVEGERKEDEEPKVKFEDLGIDATAFNRYSGRITSIDRTGRKGYLRIQGASKKASKILICDDANKGEPWWDNMRVGSNVGFSLSLNWFI